MIITVVLVVAKRKSFALLTVQEIGVRRSFGRHTRFQINSRVRFDMHKIGDPTYTLHCYAASPLQPLFPITWLKKPKAKTSTRLISNYFPSTQTP